MYTLHIAHPITDFDTWNTAFAGFASMRRQAGVRAHTVRRPVDDARYVSIDLDFDTLAGAEQFLRLLRTRVWASTDASPALAGEPITRILVTESTAQSEASEPAG
ncbi:MAG TPA: hypothetical protein VNP97_11900 [Microbacterium sp.]|nr:hypothetical protein [Microbacterium sp.]